MPAALRPVLLPLLGLFSFGCEQPQPAAQQAEALPPATAPAPPPAPAALTQGGTLPLAHILQIAQGQAPGDVIEVELEEDDGQVVYELTVLTPEGRSIEIEIDAVSGVVIKREED